MSSAEEELAGSAGTGGTIGEELAEARRVLTHMGIPEGVTAGAGIALAMTNLMQRHGRFMDLFGGELVARGVSEGLVNESATAAGLAMLRQAWGGGE